MKDDDQLWIAARAEQRGLGDSAHSTFKFSLEHAYKKKKLRADTGINDDNGDYDDSEDDDDND